MKKRNLLIPLFGVIGLVGTAIPLASCSKEQGEEKKEEITITFDAAEGEITGERVVVAKAGTKWADINVPKVESLENDRVFIGWFNGNVVMKNDMVINNDMYIVAKFTTQEEVASNDWVVTSFDDETAIVTRYNGDSPYVAVPLYANIGGKRMKITQFDFNVTENLKIVYVSKFIDFFTKPFVSPTLQSVIVDSENEKWSSTDSNGKQCNCIFHKEEQASGVRMLVFGLADAIIPEGITWINNRAFEQAYRLTEITLPSTLLFIEGYAFESTGLKSITIPKNVEWIAENAFADCESLETITFEGNNLRGLDEECFLNCARLKSIDVPEGVEYIGLDCFKNCYKLESVTIPSTVELIDYELSGSSSGSNRLPFAESTKLSSFKVDSKNEIYSSGTDNNCLMKTTDDDKQYLIEAFGGTIPSNCNIIGIQAFANRDDVTEIVFPSGVETIEESAFYQCKNLVKVTLPTTIKQIGPRVFGYCDLLSEVNFLTQIDTVPTDMFINCYSLEAISLPPTIKTLSWGCFDSSGLKSITLSDNIETIDRYVFRNTPMKEIELPKNISIGYDSFYSSDITKVVYRGNASDWLNLYRQGKIHAGAFEDEWNIKAIQCKDKTLDIDNICYNFSLPPSFQWSSDESNTFDLYEKLNAKWVDRGGVVSRDDNKYRNSFKWTIIEGESTAEWSSIPGVLKLKSGILGGHVIVNVSLTNDSSITHDTTIYVS